MTERGASRRAYAHWLALPENERPKTLKTVEEFSRTFGVEIARLVEWESDPAFMDTVRNAMGPWITRRNRVMQALLTRAQATTDSEQLRYAAAYLIAIGDERGHDLAKLIE